MKQATPEPGTKPGSKSPGGCLFAIGAFIALGAIGFVSTALFEPERQAKANECIGPSDASPAYANSCDHTVNFQYCLYSNAGADKDLCRDVSLEPGEGVTSLQTDLAQLGGLFRISLMACEAPFVPGQYEYWNTKRMTPGCVKPGDPFAGPHISRQQSTPASDTNLPDDF